MAFLYGDTCARYASVNDTVITTLLEQRYDNTGVGSWRQYTTGGRFNGPHIGGATFAGVHALYKNVTASSTLIVGLSLKTYQWADGTPIMQFYHQGYRQCYLRWRTTGALEVVDSGASTVLASSAVGVVPDQSWKRIEIKVTFHNTTGAAEVRVENTPVITATNIDTQAHPSAGLCSQVIFFENNDIHYVQDITICDTTGTSCNDFLGDVRGYVLAPNGAGNTSTSDAPVGDANRYGAVDDVAPDDDSTYNPYGGVGQQNLYTLSDLPSGSPVAVQVVTRTRKDDAGSATFRTVLRSGSTNAEGSDISPGTTYDYTTTPYSTNPNGGIAWTATAVNALEAGIKRTL